MNTTRTSVLGLLMVALGQVACDQPQPEASTDTAPPQPGVVALVNGKPLHQADLLARARVSPHHELSPAQQQNLLEPLLTEELLAQRAEQLGLAADPEYQAGLQRLQARVNTYRRERLQNLLFRHQLAAKAEVSDAEARAYFEANAERLRSELHVHQILRKEAAPLQAILKTVAAGTSFDAVLESQFKQHRDAKRRPWDLGYLKWSQIPEAWHGVVDKLEPGEVSPIIKGVNKRFWLVRLVDRRINQDLTFEQERARIKAVLQDRRIRQRRRALEVELRKAAKIQYLVGHGAG